jgi:EmrB/QacA subfamily drug resistance transporter
VNGPAFTERAIILTVGVSGLLIPLNSTMIAVALPSITRALGASVTQAGWLVTAYLITMASVQPIAGKLGDRYGRRPFLLGGVAVFALASVGAAVASNIGMLIAFRTGQAVSGAVIFPNGAALIRDVVPVARRGRMFGMLGASIALGAAIGPPLGGVLVGLGGWPAIFWVNVPLALVIFLIGWRTIPHRQSRPSGVRFDAGGAVLLALALAGGAWLLTRLGRIELAPAAAVGVIVALGFVLFVAWELRHADPVVQPRFFRRGAFVASTGAIALSNLAMYSVLLAVPLLLARRSGWSASRIGAILTTLSAGMVLLAPVGGRLADRLGRRLPALTGMALLAGGLIGLAGAGPGVSAPTLVACLAAAGAGLGLGASSLQTVAVEAIEPEHAGMAAAASSTARYVGSIVGTSVLAGLVTSRGGFQTTFTMTAIAAVASALLTVALPARRHGVVEMEAATP